MSLEKAELDLLAIQEQLHLQPDSITLINLERATASKFRNVKNDYGVFLKQKAKVSWLKYGDDNTTIFHHSIKQRRIHHSINFLELGGKIVSDPILIQRAFYDFYHTLLGTAMEHRRKILLPVVESRPALSQTHRDLFTLQFSETDIKEAL